ncbi:hypothetical protein JAO78_005055 [Alishewanella sp. 16-MA]|uniref:Uncharacterized protein n=1 Tax=Alishewanella maricola TaxID=2795740 RepID=A0ABS8C1I7_9ALTE|nr:hypothetical protein [Alishewanella maricola]MCB5226179.1 hypothetical protein [Alishewanella maricola]
MLRTDLKIFKSQRMTQIANAGGQRTAIEVANGQLNEVFGNISAIDHAQSAVDIVKVYPGVSTADTQLLQDGHVLINEPPVDPLVDVLMIEAPSINDASVRTGIIEAIESGVTAGQLLRSGLTGMLAGQNTIASSDLLDVLAANELRNVFLSLGQVIAIAVEYTGTESTTYPRFIHYAKVVGGVRSGTFGISSTTSQDDVVFEPPLPFDTPGPTASVNSQTNLTKLRLTNSTEAVKYHGVTRLTAAANQSSLLTVAKTQGNLLPKLTSVVERNNNRPFVTDTGLVRKTAEFNVAGRVYNLEISDIADLTGTIASNTISVSYVNPNGTVISQTLSFSEYQNGVLSFTLQTEPMPNRTLYVYYYSTDRYLRYQNSNAWPANSALIISTMVGTVVNTTTSILRSFYTVDGAAENQLFVNGSSGRELVAEVDFITGVITYFNGYSSAVYVAVLSNTQATADSVSTADFILAFNSIQADSLYITAELTAGGLVSASADAMGVISGVGVSGSIINGAVTLAFNDPVIAGSITYSVNEITQLTPPASLYSINQLRINNGGSVPIFNPFGVVSITNNVYTTTTDLPATLNQRPDAFIDIADSTGASLWHPLDNHYSYNKQTGVVTINNTTGFVGPFEITDTIGELALVAAVGSNSLTLTAPLQNSYPIGSVVSSVQVLGNMQASANVLFDMTTWDNVWSDNITGSPATGNFNELNYPIEVENRSAINERWVIVFTSGTAFNCIGEGLGQIASGDTLNDFAPINPNTLQPYFVILSQAWGGGWSAGECIRFNTVAAARPLVLLRSVSAGFSQVEQDSIRLHFRGNAD